MLRVLALVVTCGALAACEPPILEPIKTEPSDVPPSDEELLASRPYSVRKPSTYSEDRTWPLLIVLHGYAGSGQETLDYFELDRLVESREVLLIAPNGAQDARGNRAWRPERSSAPTWDQTWLTAVIRDAKRRYRVDASRVVVFGHSQGAHMAHRMGCDGSLDVTAVISVAGQVTVNPAACAPTRPVSVLQVHGTADTTIPYGGDGMRIPSAHDVVGVWARNDHCTGPLERQAGLIDVSDVLPGEDTVVEQYAGCPSPVSVVLWSIQGGEHRPGPSPSFASRVLSFALARPRD